MNRNHLLTALLTLAVAMPSLADIRISFPAAAAPGSSLQGNCDLFASNTVRATYQGQHDMTVPAPGEFDAVVTARVAVFEVVENLAYQRFVRYGDGRLQPGTRFTVTMNRELPGQPAAVVDTIEQMQQGDEAVMRIDHLYMMGNTTGYPVHACSRMALRKAPAPAPQHPADDTQQPDPAVPTTVAPFASGNNGLQSSGSYKSESVSFSLSGDGSMKTVRTISTKDETTGQIVTHKTINGVPVDPQTDKPLSQVKKPAAPAAQPVPAPAAPAAEPAPVQPVAPAPADTHPAEGESDDTIIEHSEPAPAAPAPAPAPAPAEEEGF